MIGFLLIFVVMWVLTVFALYMAFPTKLDEKEIVFFIHFAGFLWFVSIPIMIIAVTGYGMHLVILKASRAARNRMKKK